MHIPKKQSNKNKEQQSSSAIAHSFEEEQEGPVLHPPSLELSGEVNPPPIQRQSNTGIAEEGSRKKYAKGVKKIGKKYSKLSPAERMSKIRELLNNSLKAKGIPEVHFYPDDGEMFVGGGTRAAFGVGNWTIYYQPSLFEGETTGAEFSKLVNTLFHETRHCEQYFRVARKLAGEGKEKEEIMQLLGITYGQVAEAAIQNPLLAEQAEGDEYKEAASWEKDMINDDQKNTHAQKVNRENQAAQKEAAAAYGEAKEACQLSSKFPETSHFKSQAQEKIKLALAALERARQCYQAYLNLSVEKDAWTTGGSIEKLLGYVPSMGEESLVLLDGFIVEMIELHQKLSTSFKITPGEEDSEESPKDGSQKPSIRMGSRRGPKASPRSRNRGAMKFNAPPNLSGGSSSPKGRTGNRGAMTFDSPPDFSALSSSKGSKSSNRGAMKFSAPPKLSPPPSHTSEESSSSSEYAGLNVTPLVHLNDLPEAATRSWNAGDRFELADGRRFRVIRTYFGDALGTVGDLKPYIKGMLAGG